MKVFKNKKQIQKTEKKFNLKINIKIKIPTIFK